MPILRFSAGLTLPVGMMVVVVWPNTVRPSGKTITSKLRYVCAAIAARHSRSIQLSPGQAMTMETIGSLASGGGISTFE